MRILAPKDAVEYCYRDWHSIEDQSSYFRRRFWLLCENPHKIENKKQKTLVLTKTRSSTTKQNLHRIKIHLITKIITPNSFSSGFHTFFSLSKLVYQFSHNARRMNSLFCLCFKPRGRFDKKKCKTVGLTWHYDQNFGKNRNFPY